MATIILIIDFPRPDMKRSFQFFVRYVTIFHVHMWRKWGKGGFFLNEKEANAII